MPLARTITLSKPAYKQVAIAAIDFDVKPNELVNEIILSVDWEHKLPSLAEKILAKRKEKQP